MSILTRPLTYDDLLQLPDDTKRYEVIEGELFVTAAPTPEHQRFFRRLLLWLTGFVEPRRLGDVFAAPLDIVLGDHDIVQPDLIVISTARRHILLTRLVRGAPDLVIEILSVFTRVRDEVVQAALDASAGVPELWIVNPINRDVRVYVLDSGQYRLDSHDAGFAESRILPGFHVRLDALFANFG